MKASKGTQHAGVGGGGVQNRWRIASTAGFDHESPHPALQTPATHLGERRLRYPPHGARLRMAAGRIAWCAVRVRTGRGMRGLVDVGHWRRSSRAASDAPPLVSSPLQMGASGLARRERSKEIVPKYAVRPHSHQATGAGRVRVEAPPNTREMTRRQRGGAALVSDKCAGGGGEEPRICNEKKGTVGGRMWAPRRADEDARGRVEGLSEMKAAVEDGAVRAGSRVAHLQVCGKSAAHVAIDERIEVSAAVCNEEAIETGGKDNRGREGGAFCASFRTLARASSRIPSIPSPSVNQRLRASLQTTSAKKSQDSATTELRRSPAPVPTPEPLLLPTTYKMGAWEGGLDSIFPYIGGEIFLTTAGEEQGSPCGLQHAYSDLTPTIKTPGPSLPPGDALAGCQFMCSMPLAGVSNISVSNVSRLSLFIAATFEMKGASKVSGNSLKYEQDPGLISLHPIPPFHSILSTFYCHPTPSVVPIGLAAYAPSQGILIAKSPARRGDTSSSARCVGAPHFPFPHRVLEAGLSATGMPFCRALHGRVRRIRAPSIGLNCLHLSPRRGILAGDLAPAARAGVAPCRLRRRSRWAEALAFRRRWGEVLAEVGAAPGGTSYPNTDRGAHCGRRGEEGSMESGAVGCRTHKLVAELLGSAEQIEERGKIEELGDCKDAG
ncbi:hypothetical protein FB451DRAFT_1430110 [Mycena latifolia]|nr:hypothetical protein FB451DRAFT_1430110 [Mycena latifolia]